MHVKTQFNKEYSELTLTCYRQKRKIDLVIFLIKKITTNLVKLRKLLKLRNTHCDDQQTLEVEKKAWRLLYMTFIYQTNK